MSHHEKNHDHQSLNHNSCSDNNINLLDLLLIPARQWKMIVGVPFVLAIITVIYSLTLPNIYTAKAMIIPKDDDKGFMGAMVSQLSGLTGLTGSGGSTKTDLYVTMLKSEAIKDPIIDRFKLMQLYEAKYRAKAYNILGACSEISAGKKDGVITIEVSDKNPKLAAEMANAYIDELGKLTTNLSMTGASKNRVFLEERLVKAKLELEAAEDSLKRFQSKNKTVVVTDQAKATLESIVQFRAQLAAKEVELATMQRQFTGQSQEVKSINTTIANLRSQIAKLEGSNSKGSMPGIEDLPRLSQEYIRLMRDFKIQETLVELLTKQFEMNKLNETNNVAPFEVLIKAKTPEIKSKPHRALMAVFVIILSSTLMILLSFAREFIVRMGEEDQKRLKELLNSLPFPRFLMNGRPN